ncbi:MAG: acyltransferase family protein [Subdoligranulum variabile]|nr:acyltransferase family protein [Subdoligranulum variabile]
MPGKTQRSSNLELLRILCMLLIIGDHLTGQGGIADYTTLPSSFAFCLIGCGSRIACSVFILIGGWFLCEQPYKTRRPLSLWLSLWLYTVPVTLLCRLAGLDVSLGALRWAAFPASTRQLWFISDYLLLLLCVPLLNRVLRGLPRTAHRGLLAVLAVPMILYPTLFGENGIVSDTAWMFLYEYLLAAYLRRYPENRLARLLQNRAAALALGLGLPLVNTAIRAVLETRGLTDGKAFQYVAYYRTALGALPNLLAALALLVPAFRNFLWNGLLQAQAHHGSVVYTLFAIFAVFFGCAAVDAVRTRLVMRPLENTKLFTALCEKGDALAAKITADD